MSETTKTAQEGFINIGMDAASGVSLSKGDLVEITAADTVNKPSGAGSIKIIGEVTIPTRAAGGECTIGTFFSKQRNLVTGAAVTVGAPVVVDASNKVIDYDSGSHSVAAIIGIAMEGSTGADETIKVLVK